MSKKKVKAEPERQPTKLLVVDVVPANSRRYSHYPLNATKAEKKIIDAENIRTDDAEALIDPDILEELDGELDSIGQEAIEQQTDLLYEAFAKAGIDKPTEKQLQTVVNGLNCEYPVPYFCDI